MFSIGEIISYPMHGIGRIEAIEEREIKGVVNSYYVLRFGADGAKVLLPVDKAADGHLRLPVAAEKAEEVLCALSSPCEIEEFANWNRRYRANIERLKTGDIDDIAAVVKALFIRSCEKGLSSGEKTMLSNAMNFMVDELAVSLGLAAEAVREDAVSRLTVTYESSCERE